MSEVKRVAVVVRSSARAAEALRAAVGLTLRGDRVCVVPLCPLPDEDGVRRALGTLRALGHDVDGAVGELRSCAAVEVWT